jgi:hypothetical protein
MALGRKTAYRSVPDTLISIMPESSEEYEHGFQVMSAYHYVTEIHVTARSMCTKGEIH